MLRNSHISQTHYSMVFQYFLASSLVYKSMSIPLFRQQCLIKVTYAFRQKFLLLLQILCQLVYQNIHL